MLQLNFTVYIARTGLRLFEALRVFNVEVYQADKEIAAEETRRTDF